MLRGRTILSVTPARGGSKGVKLKNLRSVGGYSLIEHVARVIRQCGEIDEAVVSTDHEAIAAEAERCGLSVPFRRPAALSRDRVGDLDVLTHALLASEDAFGCRFDVVVMLQPTSPLRTPDHVVAAVTRLIEGRYDSVWTVSPADVKFHPLKQLRVTENGSLQYYSEGASDVIARQQLETLFYRNGACYAFTRKCLLEQQVILGAKSAAVVIDEVMVSIDTEEDLRRVDRLLVNRLKD